MKVSFPFLCFELILIAVILLFILLATIKRYRNKDIFENLLKENLTKQKTSIRLSSFNNRNENFILKELMIEIKRLRQEMEVLNSNRFSIATNLRVWHKEFGVFISTIGFSILLVSFSVPDIQWKNMILFLGLGLFVLGGSRFFCSLMYEKIHQAYPSHAKNINEFGLWKYPFDKIWFKQWKSGQNIPCYSLTSITETLSTFLLYITLIYTIIRSVEICTQ